MRKLLFLVMFLLVGFGLLGIISCDKATPPPLVQSVVLKGDAYERGFQHGQALSTHIKSLYTRLLESSIVPFLNREQMSIAPVVPIYKEKEYLEGRFSKLMLLESGQNIWDNYLPEKYKQELQGIADGAGVDLDSILILNTFFDTMMGFRAIVLFIQGIQEPYITTIDFGDKLNSDGIDNDGDGETDEEGEAVIDAYEQSPYAQMLEVPTTASIKFVMKDPELGGLACIDPRNVEPIGEMDMRAECVDMDCVNEAFRQSQNIVRGMTNKIALECLPPRIIVDCLDINCIEPIDPGCVNPDSIRIRHNQNLYVAGDPEIKTELLGEGVDFDSMYPEDYPYALRCKAPLQITFTPPGGFEAASVQTLKIQAGDMSPVYSPEPYHNRNMRDERFVFTTEGYAAKTGSGKLLHEVENRGETDDAVQPTSIAFAVRDSATPDGNPLVANHYALLDSDMMHKHTVVFTHIPDDGPAFTYTGWAGLAWGFSGMNSEGMTFVFNNSDSLDNPLVGVALDKIFENINELIVAPDLEGLSRALADVKLMVHGMPIGFAGRSTLESTTSVDQAIEHLYGMEHSYGWNVLLADSKGDMAAVEVDGGIRSTEERPATPENIDGFQVYTPDDDPENIDPYGNKWGSEGPDDLRIASHFRKNYDDMVDLSIMGQFAPPRQRGWTGYYYRSVRSFYLLGDEIEKSYGEIDLARAVEILREPELVDPFNSMTACIFEPAHARMHWALGIVPATDAPFLTLDLKAVAEQGGAK